MYPEVVHAELLLVQGSHLRPAILQLNLEETESHKKSLKKDCERRKNTILLKNKGVYKATEKVKRTCALKAAVIVKVQVV